MGTGIGAAITTFSPGTTISSSSMNASLSAINADGVGNDSGSIFTSGAGLLSAVGFAGGNSGISTNGVGLASLGAKIQSVSGDSGGTMSVLETFSGNLKIVIIEQNSYKQAGSAQLITLQTQFTFMALIMNFGCGGIVQASSGSVNSNNQVSWGASTSPGSSASVSQVQVDCACYSFGGFNQVGSNGGYASSHTGIAIIVGI